MAKRICLLTGNETKCTDGCYRCGCGGEVALNDCYVPIYNIQRVCDIVKNMADVSTEGEEIAEYIRNELEKMVIPAADVQPVNQWISVDDKLPDTVDDCLVWYSCDTAFGKSKSVGISFCSRCDWYKKHLNGDNIVVLYWMPLPEPPKDGEHND